MNLGSETQMNARPNWSATFTLFLMGQIVSNIGSSISSIAMSWLIMKATGSATKAGLIMMATVIPNLMVAPIAGVIVDRYSRRRLMVMIDLFSAVIGGVMAILSAGTPNMAVLLGYFLFKSSLRAFYFPSSLALVPNLVPSDELVRANAMQQTSLSFANIIGPIIGAGIIAKFGLGTAFALDAISFLASVTTLTIIQCPEQISSPMRDRKGVGFAWVEAKDGLRYALQNPTIVHLLMLTGFVNVTMSAQNVVLPFFVRDTLGDVTALGALYSAASVGSLLVSAVTSLLKKFPHKGLALLIATSIVAATQITLSLSTTVEQAMVSVALINSAGMLMGICMNAIYQITVEDHYKGRVFSLRQLVSQSMTSLGAGAGGLLADFTSAGLVILSGGIVALLLSMISFKSRQIRGA